MISRHWTGLCKKEKADHYIQHLREDTFQKLGQLEGFIRASILKREIADGVEFLIVTEWESLTAIKQFAGNNYDTAVVPESVQKMMVKYDNMVRHYEINFTTEP
jgi:heme-degrading monooxygenase HmoA